MHNGCVLTGGVGVGKTFTALLYYYTKVGNGVPNLPGLKFREMTTPKDIYVITTARKRDELDWNLEAAMFGIGRESGPDGIQIHVDSWNNISQYELVADAFFIFDENRIVGSGAWVKSFLKIARANQWIVLSATPGDVWLDYVPLFLAHGFFKNKSQFIENHVEYSRFAKYPQVKRYHGEKKLEALRNRILVDMPYERHTVRHEHMVTVKYDEETYRRVTKDRWHVYEDRPLKDAGEMQIVMRRVVNSDISRWGELLKVYEKHPKLIVFYNFNYELDILRFNLDALGITYAEWNGSKHQPIPGTDSWIYLVQYTAGAEAWNCTDTNAIFFWSLNYSYKVWEQSKGRIDRLDTPFKDLYYYICRSTAKIDTNIWRALLTKKNFNERAYAKQIWDEHVPF